MAGRSTLFAVNFPYNDGADGTGMRCNIAHHYPDIGIWTNTGRNRRTLAVVHTACIVPPLPILMEERSSTVNRLAFY